MYSYFSNIIKWISDRLTGVKNMVATSGGDSVILCDRFSGAVGDTEELWLTNSEECLTENILPVYLRSDQTALNLKN